MWYEKRTIKSGAIRYVYYERYKDIYSGKEKRVSITLNSASNQAQKAAVLALQEKIALATRTKDLNATFEDVATEWIEYISPLLKPASIRGYIGLLKSLLLYLPSHILISNINISVIQSLLNELYHRKNMSFSYIKTHLVVLKSILKYAKRMRYVDDISFLEDVELRQKPKTIEELKQKRNKFLDHDELKEALSQLKEFSLRVSLSMEFISLTGLRFGELVALRVCDYDKENGVIDVNGTISSFKTNSDVTQRGTPKNTYSFRKVALTERAVYILDYMIADNKRLAWSTAYKNRGYIFTSIRGNPFNLQYVNRILRKVNIPDKKLSTHIFRHTHISILAELNVPLKAIMERVGHNDPRTTLSVYTHVSEKAKKELVEKLSNYVI